MVFTLTASQSIFVSFYFPDPQYVVHKEDLEERHSADHEGLLEDCLNVQW